MGVAPTAPASVIRAAYRALAMELHPDRNAGPNSTKRFQELQRAYEVLSNSARRAAYDSSSNVPEQKRPPSSDRQSAHSSETSTSYEPLRCGKCNSVTASPRYRVFFRVFGYLFGAERKPYQGIYCSRCEMVEGLKCTGITAVVGWWSLHGFFWTSAALYQNLFGANAFAEQNARLLAHQVGYFMFTGNQASHSQLLGKRMRQRCACTNQIRGLRNSGPGSAVRSRIA